MSKPKLPRLTPSEAAAPDTFARLKARHPDAHCELNHASPFQLIVATVLSAQTTDVLVNLVTPELFARWPTPEALAAAERPEVEQVLGRIGMFRQKAKNITTLAAQLLERHQGAVPRTLNELTALAGVGRKTANVVLGVAFGAPEGVVVDTHVGRLSQRLGWSKQALPEKIEQDLMQLFPRGDWDLLSHTLIFHGRRVCSARSPACAACPVSDACPSAFAAEQVGRKPPRARGPAGTPSKPASGKAGATKAAATKPAATKPAATKPAATKPAATKPAAPKQPAGASRRAPVARAERKR